MKKVLFIAHDASRAGAQLLLLQLLSHFKKQAAFQMELIVKESGELISAYADILPTHIWNIKTNSSYKKINSIIKRWHKKKLLQYLKKQHFDLIYCNTITNGHILQGLSFLNIPVITHVHELNYWIERSGEENLRFIKEYSHQYIAVSQSVKNCMVEDYNIEPNKIEVINGFVDIDHVISNQYVNIIKNTLHLSKDAIIIAACGVESWRKGKDIFIPLAIQVLKSIKKDIHFVWIGGNISFEIKYDVLKSGYEKNIHFMDNVADAYRYFNDIDIFLMLSREDPFPLVNLEVAALSKPILCFADTGGTAELLESHTDFVIDYMDIVAMAEKIIELIYNEEYVKKIGIELQFKVQMNNDISIISSLIQKKIISI